MNTMDFIQVRCVKGRAPCSIHDFLKMENLSGIVKKIQDAVRTLYELNNRKPPLFNFPNFEPEKPLLIDCITPTDDDCSAHYVHGAHVVEFVRDLHDNPEREGFSFTEILAHELTHAEQDIKEINDWTKINGSCFAQIHLLMEAQAFAKARKVHYLLQGDREYARYMATCTRPDGTVDEAAADTKMQELMIKTLFKSEFYRDMWAEHFPAKKEDLPLPRIPMGFHMSSSLLALVHKLPKKPVSMSLMDLSYIRKHQWQFYNYFLESDTTDKRKRLLANTFITRLLFDEKATPATLEADMEMLQFMLRLTDKNGGGLFPETYLQDLFFEQAALEGREDSPLLKNAENAVGKDNQKLFPDNFSTEGKYMKVSEFLRCVSRYFDIIHPVVNLDDVDLNDMELITPTQTPKKKKITHRRPTPKKMDAVVRKNLRYTR